MTINKAIRQAMRNRSVSLSAMGNALRKFDKKTGDLVPLKASDVSARLVNNNLSFDVAVEMLSILGYEVVIQEKRSGSRRADQVVIDQIPEGE